MAHILQQLLSKSAALYPDKTAVWARNKTLTYRELAERSNQLAHLLRQNGLKKGDRVGIYFPKALESIICMFGVLKAGGVYVPLDPQAPAERVGYIIHNCGIRILLSNCEKQQGLSTNTQQSLELCVLTDSTLKASNGTRVIPWTTLSQFPATELTGLPFTETDLAYILYTSGSTGRPKGVMLSHQNALTFVEWCAATFHVSCEDRLSNHAPLHFDLSVFDVYNAIEAGATVYLVSEEIALFPTTLAAFIESKEISIWYSVPSALILLLLHGNLKAEKLAHLRTILFAGEVFPMKYLRQLAELLPGVDLYNLYGPTETNVCTYHQVERERLGGMEKLPIGAACANTEVFAINDLDQKVTAPGETGELFVRGPAVTYGYWGDPEKTRKMVVPNRFQENFEEKMYRTGDLVTLGEDGYYYFLGRRDSMIKSRGYRIELGEIESALLNHAGVREAAAVAIPDEVVGNRIKAFVALHAPQSLKGVDLQHHCALHIPKYMIPEIIEFCSDLPKTSTGKIDRVHLARSAMTVAV
jgi:amino acid adenylation domain-containing protein